ncbi:MAG: hypothetical protein ACAH59_13525 [Pseudobdellovibrionaceae bacterium]
MKDFTKTTLLMLATLAFAWSAEAKSVGYSAASQYFVASNSGTQMSARQHGGKSSKKKKANRGVASEKTKKAKKQKPKKRRH